MRSLRGWVGLLLLLPAAAHAGDLAVTRVEATVSARHADGTANALRNHDPLDAGDTVSTGKDGHVSMRFAGGGSLQLGSDAALQIEGTQPPEPPGRASLAYLELLSGAAHVDARKIDEGAPADIRISLRYLKARLYGTDAWVERSAAGDEICLISGAAEIDTPGAHQRLDSPGECLRWTATGARRLTAAQAGSLLPRLAATNFTDDFATRYAAAQAERDGSARPTLAQSAQPHDDITIEFVGATRTQAPAAPVEPAAPQAKPAIAARAKSEWRIALGVFSQRANAEHSAARWRARNLTTEIEVITLKRRAAYRLLCGHYRNRDEAEAALKRLRKRPGYTEARVLQVPDDLSRR